ncbi:MAG: cysteine desulfurase family protein [Limisphaerales bacterium]
MIYLDHNATTPVRPEVFEAMRPFFTERWGNPSSSYHFGAELKGVLETAREQVAGLVGARPSEILFTGGATEANHTALHAALKANPGKRHLITSQVEHSSVLGHCRALAAEGCRLTCLPVDREGLLKLADLENALTDDTAVVSLMWANNETGVLFPVADIAQLCRARGVLFHCDAVQAAGKLPVDTAAVPADYLSLSGHKFGAPKGVGALYVRRKSPFSPWLHGGHQERGRRGGTESVPLIAGLGAAAELARQDLPDYEDKVRPLRDALEAGILGNAGGARLSERARERPAEDCQPHLATELNGHPTRRLPNTTNLTFPGIESEALLLLLDQEGLCASSGSACLADSDEPSHVVKAMKPDTGASRQMIRFSLGMENSAKDVNAAIAAIRKAVNALRD